MHHRWIAILLCSIGIGYTAGALVGSLLSSTDSFSLRVRVALGLLFAVAVGAGVVAHRIRSGGVRWDRVLAEQRLWESGTLGRRWLGRRRRLSDHESW